MSTLRNCRDFNHLHPLHFKMLLSDHDETVKSLMRMKHERFL